MKKFGGLVNSMTRPPGRGVEPLCPAEASPASREMFLIKEKGNSILYPAESLLM